MVRTGASGLAGGAPAEFLQPGPKDLAADILGGSCVEKRASFRGQGHVAAFLSTCLLNSSLFLQLSLVWPNPETLSVLAFPEKTPAEFCLGKGVAPQLGRGGHRWRDWHSCLLLRYSTHLPPFSSALLPKILALPLSETLELTQHHWD